MNLDAMQLMQRIVQSPNPPPAQIVLLSAWGEAREEHTARLTHARDLGYQIHALWAENTYAEARTARAAIGTPSDLIIVTSAYHQLRAFLTFVKVFEGTGVRLWNAPAPSAWDKLEGELEKIATYQQRGHVATYAEGLEHLAWRDAYNCAGTT